MALPRFLLLKSNANNKYLSYVKDQANHAYLRFCYQLNDKTRVAGQDNNFSLFRHRFEVEKSKTFPDLVHIRSCYNNKYWIRKSAPNNYIAAEAHEAEEDQSKLSCTLFKPIVKKTYVEDAFPTCKAHKIQLLHVCGAAGQRKLRAITPLSDESKISYLAVGDDDDHEELEEDDDQENLGFTAIDVEKLAVLPEYVVFMGDNNMYASNSKSPLTFSETELIGKSNIVSKVVQTKSELLQAIYLQDREGLNYWKKDDKELLRMSSTDKSFFIPVKINNLYTALNYFDSTWSKFVGSESSDQSLKVTSFAKSCMLRVGEPVLSREIISQPTYDKAHSRVYSVSKVEVFRDTRSNFTKIEQVGTFEVKYTTQRSMNWTQSSTVNLGTTFSLSFGIPTIVTTGTVELSFGVSKTVTWNEEVTETSDITFTQTVKIPENSKVTLKVEAKRGNCDVPFTCRVRDVMTDGTVREYEKTDGLYSGSNEFEFDTEIHCEELHTP